MKLTIALAIIGIVASAHAQYLKRTFSLEGQLSTQPSSNSISQILITSDTVYFATSKGLNQSVNGGGSFKTDFGKGGPTGVSVNSIAVKGDTIIACVSSTSDQGGTSYPVGQGLYASTDDGSTWTKTAQSLDTLTDTTVTFGKNTLRALPVTTAINNISYSVVFHKGHIYTANFAGGLRRSPDLGAHWERVVLPPDNLEYITKDSTYDFQLSPVAGNITDENNFNHRVFSLYSDGDSVLWVGTADGINKTTDNGYSWYKFDHQHGSSPISGNFVVALSAQDSGSSHYIWGATVVANDPSEVSALSYTTDFGATWKTIMSGHFFHGMAFQNDIVYGVSDDGLFRSQDFGRTFQVVTNLHDPSSNQWISSPIFYAVATIGDSVWVASADGMAVGIDNRTGFDLNSWRILRTYIPVGTSGSTYFYPNPFSPHLDVGRVHYFVKSAGSKITIRIFDFSMHVVKTLLQDAIRDAGETDQQWNGTGDGGGLVDNGVYFFSVVVNGGNPAWGKILVLR